MPQAPSKETTGSSNSLVYPLLSAVVFSNGLEGSKSGKLTKARQGPKITSKFTADKPPVHNGQTFRESYPQTNTKPSGS
jgi:hypothetical protein